MFPSSNQQGQIPNKQGLSAEEQMIAQQILFMYQQQQQQQHQAQVMVRPTPTPMPVFPSADPGAPVMMRGSQRLSQQQPQPQILPSYQPEQQQLPANFMNILNAAALSAKSPFATAPSSSRSFPTNSFSIPQTQQQQAQKQLQAHQQTQVR
jgi:hypothetical protein